MTVEAMTRALRGYGQTSALGTSPLTSEASGAGSAGGASFADLVKQEVGQTYQSISGGEQASIAAVNGTGDTQAVVEAVSQAELSLQKLTAIRDKVVAAYQEIMRMPI